jgi:hypothetical protein
VPFFAPFLGKQKRREIKKENISVEYVLYYIELTFFFLDEKEPKNQVRNMLPPSFRGSARISDFPTHGCC